MKIWHQFATIAIASPFMANAEAGLPSWKFWKSDSCSELTSCAPVPERDVCLDGSHSADCCGTEPWRPFSGVMLNRSRTWMKDVCGDIRGRWDSHEPWSYCVLPDILRNDSCTLATSGKCQSQQLAELIYLSQTACDPAVRRRAVSRIGNHFDGACYPDVYLALAYALTDCDHRVRCEAADELGDQLRRCQQGCSPVVIERLEQGLNDSHWNVRRQSAQALRACGYSCHAGQIAPIDSCCGYELGCVDSLFDVCLNESPEIGLEEPVYFPGNALPEVLLDRSPTDSPNDLTTAHNPLPEPTRMITLEPVEEADEESEEEPITARQLFEGRLAAPGRLRPSVISTEDAGLPAETQAPPVPAPPIRKPKPGRYVPEDDSAGFIMPSPKFRERIGLLGTQEQDL